MELKERQSRERPAVSGNPWGPEDGDGTDPLHAAADDLLRAADAAVARVLSADSQAFLTGMHQDGGQ